MAHTFPYMIIDNGETLSNAIELGTANHVRAMLISTPASLAESVGVDVQLSDGGPWYTLTSGGAAVAFDVALRAYPLTDIAARSIRLLATPLVAGARLFESSGGWK